MKTITVYHGDNGVQEFWESEGDGICLFRNHGVDRWLAMECHRDGGPTLIDDTEATEFASHRNPAVRSVPVQATSAEACANKAIKMLGPNVRIEFSAARRWVNCGNGMRCVPTKS